MQPATEYARELRTALRLNATAYGYSLMITATFGVLSAQLGTPGVFDVFLFAVGAVFGFIVLEAAASRGFRKRGRGERADVVMLGSAMSLVSVTSGVGAAALTSEILRTDVAWAFGSGMATCMYMVIVSLEFLLARRAEEQREG